MKIHNRGKFHLYSFCGSQVINVQMVLWRCSIHELTHFGGFGGPNCPQNSQIKLKFGPEVEYYETMTAV